MLFFHNTDASAREWRDNESQKVDDTRNSFGMSEKVSLAIIVLFPVKSRNVEKKSS